MPQVDTPIHIPLPIDPNRQVGVPTYVWVYTGSGAITSAFRICDQSYVYVSELIITLGLITADGQKFFQYYYQVSYAAPNGDKLFAEGYVPAGQLVRFVAENLSFNANGSGPVAPNSIRGKKKR
jgi:hypothetical protein